MKNLKHAILVSSLSALLACLAPALQAQAPVPDSPAIEAQAHAMLAKLTLEQKIELLGGVDNMYTHPMPSIGLPRFKMSDASVGVRTWGPTTAYAGGVALAATWDTDFARTLGASLGKDARARNVNFLLGPGVNIARSPIAGRNFEYLSEDPFLNATIVVPFIQGVQSQGVIATVKHYALNNQECNRHNASSDVDERTMREIYLPAFEAAVVKGHVDSVMNSYNLINGVHATQNEFLNLKVLKGEWGFQGVLMSDWDATYDGVAAANNGLDLEMPTPKFMNAKNLLPAVKSGAVKESTIDDKVLRLLRTELRYGFTDRPQFDPADSTYSVADRAVALQGARESITLLKNEGHLLPLDPARIKTIAIIGPDAWPAIVGGGGSSEAAPFEPVSTLTGIANLLGPDVHVLYSSGLPSILDVFRNTKWNGPVKVETFPSRDFTGTPATATRRNIADWRHGQGEAPDPTPRSIRYTASFKAENAGKYLLIASSAGEDAFKLFTDGKQTFDQAHADRPGAHASPLSISPPVKPSTSRPTICPTQSARISVSASSTSPTLSPPKLSSSRKSPTWLSLPLASIRRPKAKATTAPSRSPGARTLSLKRLPPPIRTPSSPSPVAAAWIRAAGSAQVPALLHTWYPGQEGGTAVAEVLFGKQNPEGKLPISFDSDWESNPSRPFYYGTPGADTTLHTTGADGKPLDYTIPHINYGDRLMVGYRYWTTTGKHPLFPFGFGLSYTTFRFANLHAPATAASGATVPVSFDVTNTGSVAGAEVAQLYVSDPSAKATRPERELKGFEKVRLAPGETRHVTLNLDARAFSYWDEAAHKWTIDPGKFVILVGDSSENTPLHVDVTLN